MAWLFSRRAANPIETATLGLLFRLERKEGWATGVVGAVNPEIPSCDEQSSADLFSGSICPPGFPISD
jgi:hypothetical protein